MLPPPASDDDPVWTQEAGETVFAAFVQVERIGIVKAPVAGGSILPGASG